MVLTCKLYLPRKGRQNIRNSFSSRGGVGLLLNCWSKKVLMTRSTSGKGKQFSFKIPFILTTSSWKLAYVEHMWKAWFLDVSVTHDQNSFSTSLYRKKTFTGLYTDFGTLSPNKYKVNLIRVLVYRAFHICSTYANFHEEVVRIKGILKENCFPLPLVDRVIKTFLDQQFSKRPTPPREEKEFLIFCLPFLGRYSLQVKTKLIRLLKQCYPTVKLKVIFNSPKRLASYFRFKDRLPILMCSSVVYSYKCPGCHALYYGKTTRNLVTRCREHLGINKAGQKIKSNCSAIGDHISKSGHNGSLDDFHILSKTENSFDLLIHESLLILRDHPSLNSQQSSIPLVLF